MEGLVAQFEHLEFPIISFHSTPSDNIVACSYSRDSVNRGGQVSIFDKDLKQLYAKTLSSAAFHMDFYWDYDTGIIKTADGKIAMFRVKDQTLVYEGVDNKNVMITDCAYNFFTLDEIVYTDSEGSLKRYARQAEKIVSTVRAHSMCGNNVSGWSVEYIDENTVMSGGDDNTLKVWDKRQSKPASVCDLFSGGVVRIRKQKQHHFYTGSYDQHLRYFDVRKLDCPINHVKVSKLVIILFYVGTVYYSTHSFQLEEGDPWDFQIYSNGNIAAAAMYDGIYLLNNDLSIAYHQKIEGSLMYGINCFMKDEKLRITCTSFTPGIAYIFDISPENWTVPTHTQPSRFRLMTPETWLPVPIELREITWHYYIIHVVTVLFYNISCILTIELNI